MISKTPNSLTTRPLFDDFFPEKILTFVTTRDDDYRMASAEDPFDAAQQEALRTGAGVDPARVCTIKQVHGARMVGCHEPPRPVPEADGLYTDTPGLALAVRTADCLPIIFFDPARPAVGLVHAGWRGTAQLIARAAVTEMSAAFGSDPSRLRVAFGPCIRLHSYEVGPEFREHFPGEVIAISGRDHFDLALANRRQLREAGVLPDNIVDCGICTFEDAHYHSYRRDADRAGRNLTLIMIKE